MHTPSMTKIAILDRSDGSECVTRRTDEIDKDLDHLGSDLLLRCAVQDLHGTDLTQEICP